MLIAAWPRRSPEVPPAAGLLVRGVFAAVLGIEIAVVVRAVWIKPDLLLTEVVEEKYGVLEWVQVGLWVLTALVALVACLRQTTWRGVCLALWLGLVAVVASVRELDLHVLVNPGNIHLLGLDPEQAVRFRLDWWTDPATPIAPRVVWAIVLLGGIALLVLPFALATYPWPRRILNFDRFAWIVCCGFGLLLLSFVEDDLLRGPLSRADVDLSLMEELLELGGQVLLVIGVGLLAARAVKLHPPRDDRAPARRRS